MTQDVVYAMGRLITELPGVLSRRVDPRAALSMVWGAAEAGRAANAIPTSGRLRGTLRVFGHEAWDAAEPLIRELVDQLVAAVAASGPRRSTPAASRRSSTRPPPSRCSRPRCSTRWGPSALTDTEQSMGGEDFAWYLESVPGALARLGVRRPGGAYFDLHQGTFDIDEAALAIGVRYTVALARAALAR